MPEKIVQLNEEIIKGQITELVRSSVEKTLNELLEKRVRKCCCFGSNFRERGRLS